MEKAKTVLLVAADRELGEAIAGRLAVEVRAPLDLCTVDSLDAATRAGGSVPFELLLLDQAVLAGEGQPSVALIDLKGPLIVFQGAELAGQAPDSRPWADLKQAVGAALVHKLPDRESLRRVLYDEHTGLPTEVLLIDLLNAAVARARRSGLHVALVPFRLAGLDDLEGRFGEKRAEKIFKFLLRHLASCLRSSDIVAYLGGADYAILMEVRNGHDDAVLVAERVREIMSGDFAIEGASLEVAMTIRGPIMCEAETEDLGQLLRQADPDADSAPASAA